MLVKQISVSQMSFGQIHCRASVYWPNAWQPNVCRPEMTQLSAKGSLAKHPMEKRLLANCLYDKLFGRLSNKCLLLKCVSAKCFWIKRHGGTQKDKSRRKMDLSQGNNGTWYYLMLA